MEDGVGMKVTIKYFDNECKWGKESSNEVIDVLVPHLSNVHFSSSAGLAL